MLCPIDGSTLTMSERSGIEIDYCPQCRGVWLDRGELDKLIERSITQQPAAASLPPGSYERDRDDRRQRQDQRYVDAYQQPHRRKRKESWLSEIFD